MKYLQDYMSERQTKALDKAGAFFAFSKSQFEEQKVEGVKYMNGPAGMICPVDTYSVLADELNKIYQSSIKQDIEENGLTNIVIRELNNYECYYSGDIEDAVDALKDYPISYNDVQTVYKNKNSVLV